MRLQRYEKNTIWQNGKRIILRFEELGGVICWFNTATPMLEVRMGYSWDIRGVFTEYSWDIRMCRVCIGYVSGMCRECIETNKKNTGRTCIYESFIVSLQSFIVL